MHHPPHVYLDDTWYMITGAVYENRRLLQAEGYKVLVEDQLKALVAEFKFTLAAWVVLDNHYHILAKSHEGAMLSRFIGRLHGRTSFEINSCDGTRGRQVWHNYWDTCIRTETDYWTRFNYIHNNPVKHRYVKELEEWPFSSYRHHLEREGATWMMDVLERYPVIDFTDLSDGFDT
jgi:putative transposase